MKKHLLFTLLLLLSIGFVAGQTWIRSISFSGVYPPEVTGRSALLCNVIPAIGGGYLLQGYLSVTSNDGLVEVYSGNVFWKYNENGDLIWRRTSGGDAFDSVVSNGVDLYYCMTYHSGTTRLYVFNAELDLLGYWDFNAVNGYSANLYDMQYTDSGLVFAGGVGYRAVVLKTGFGFNTLWQSEIFGMGEAKTVEPYDNGWISLLGRRFVEFGATGDTLWTYTNPEEYSSSYDCTISDDNSIYLLGSYKLWKVDAVEHSVTMIADNIPGGWDYNGNNAIDVLPNGNIVYTGRDDTNHILHSYSPEGVHQWSRTYNTLGASYFGTGSKNLLVMPDGSILFCMYHNGYVLVKTDVAGNVVDNDDPVAPAPVASIVCYPQPASSNVIISIKSDLFGDLGYSIFNIKGQRVYSGKIDGNCREQSFELPSEALERMTSGVYLISLEQGDRSIATSKLVVVK